MPAPAGLADWLAHAERLHTRSIDLGLERVGAVRARLGIAFDAVLVVVGGTNGKGSTCAMLESIALAAGYRVGLHTSPHLVRFEERCRIGGEAVDGATLVPHLAAVEAARGDTPLTWHEFTLLAIARRLAGEPLDLVILEVGLGGRLDAVNVFDADCAAITSIDIDHVEYLGPDRESIGYEKAGILRGGRPGVVADPLPPASLLAHAASIGCDLRTSGRDFRFSGDRQQWQWEGRTTRYAGLAYPSLRGANQLLNAAGVLAALEALRDRLPVAAGAIRQGLATVDLPGRFQVVPGEPVLVLDVAHNPHAIATLAANLDAMGFHPRTHAVFGAMRDKDLDAMIRILAPLVDGWHLTDLPIARAATAAQLADLCRVRAPGKPVTTHADPVAALAAARAAAEPADRIVVFGSFHTVGGVLAHGLPGRRPAPA